MSASWSKQLVNLVNPRLALYTRAGLLAAIILVLNYAIVVALSLWLMGLCSETTMVDRTRPVTFGDFTTYEEFLNVTLSREGVVS